MEGSIDLIQNENMTVMKNIKYALVVLAAVLSVVSCTKEIENEKPVFGEGSGKGNLIINAVAGSLGKSDPETKAVGSFGYDVLWEENDQISVIDDSNNQGLFNLIDGVGETLGKFQQTTGTTLSGTVTGYYPASLLQEDGTLFWPAEQTYSKELTGIPMTAFATIAEEGGTNFNFKNLGGVLQLVFSTKTEGITVTSITLEHNRKPLSEEFTVNEDGQAIMAANPENPGITLDLGKDGVSVGVAAKYFYIAIPAGTYSGGREDEVMTITFSDDVHGKECVMTSTTFPEVKRNTVGRITLAKDFTDQHFTVKFDMNNSDKTGDFTDKPDDITNIAYGSTILAPNMPFAKNYGFRGWYKDKDCTEPYGFSSKVTEDMTLYAKWAADPKGNIINGHDCVKLAGYYWATENVGECENLPSIVEPGTEGNDWGLYFYSQKNASATALSWGGSWTLPSEAQWQALLDNCDWKWMDKYDNSASPYYEKSGYLVTGKEANYEKDHSIFLPAAGIYDDISSKFSSQGKYGYYWSTDYKRYLDLQICELWNKDPYNGMSVRLVSE